MTFFASVLVAVWACSGVIAYGYSVAWFEGEYPRSRETVFGIVINRAVSALLGLVLGPFAIVFLYWMTDHLKHGWRA